MFGNYYNWGWGGWSYPQTQAVSYSPFTNWTNGFSSNPNVPFGGSVYNLDRWDTGGVGTNTNSNQMYQQADYVRRLQILQALGPGAEQRIPNWRTMSMNELVLEAARIKGVGGTNRVNPTQNGQRLPVNVTAHSYYENGEQVPVKKVNIWDLGANDQNYYNSSRQTDYYARFDKGIQGKKYRVMVEWENGRTYIWDHFNNGGNITVWQPNQ